MNQFLSDFLNTLLLALAPRSRHRPRRLAHHPLEKSHHRPANQTLPTLRTNPLVCRHRRACCRTSWHRLYHRRQKNLRHRLPRNPRQQIPQNRPRVRRSGQHHRNRRLGRIQPTPLLNS